MAAKIGTGDILFRVGSGSPSRVFLGTAAVQTVPGAPTVSSAITNVVDLTTVIGSGVQNGAGVTSLRAVFTLSGYPTESPTPASETITNNADGTYDFTLTFGFDWDGYDVQVFASNAIGESAGSTPVGVAA